MFNVARNRVLASAIKTSPRLPGLARPAFAQQQKRALSIHEYLSAELLSKVSLCPRAHTQHRKKNVPERY